MESEAKTGTKRRKKVVATLVVTGFLLLVSAFVLYNITRLEPRYEGKPLTQWIEELEWKSWHSEWRVKTDQEIAVVDWMKSNSLPYLLKMLHAEDSRVKKTIMSWWKSLPGECPFRPAQEQHTYALAGFEIVRPDVKPPWEDVIRAYNSEYEKVKGFAVRSILFRQGPESISQMTELLSNPDAELRLYAVSGIGRLKSKKAIPAFLLALKDKKPNIRASAANGLKALGIDAEDALPALRIALEDDSPKVRKRAAAAIEVITKGNTAP